jgi:Gluconate 2-dehydrogenase subunit 3
MSKINRRAFMKKAVYLGAGLIAVGGIGARWKVVERTLVQSGAPGNPPEGKSGRAQDGSHWFTLAEFATIKALASVIVPSDGNGPGAAEVDVAGQLDRLVAATPRRQESYRAGLAAIDKLAMQQYQRVFAALGMKEQIELFGVVDGARQAMEKDPVSILDRASRKIHFLYYYRWLGVTPAAADFCHYVVLDVKEIFYSSQAAWAWLGYEGPPFPLGYFSKPDNCPIGRA